MNNKLIRKTVVQDGLFVTHFPNIKILTVCVRCLAFDSIFFYMDRHLPSREQEEVVTTLFN